MRERESMRERDRDRERERDVRNQQRELKIECNIVSKSD